MTSAAGGSYVCAEVKTSGDVSLARPNPVDVKLARLLGAYAGFDARTLLVVASRS